MHLLLDFVFLLASQFCLSVDFVFARSSVPSSPTPKPQRVKKSRSRDSYVSQNSTDSLSGK